VNDRYNENYKTPMKENIEKTEKWEDIPSYGSE
jgi:hypothetical protein